MKKTAITTALTTILVLRAGALEIGMEGKISNIGFSQAQTAPTDAGIKEFPANQFFWGAKIFVKDEIAENLFIYAEYDMDPVLRNTAKAVIEYRMNFLKVAAGPTFGILNSTTTFLKSGLAAKAELEWPGVGLFKAEADTSIGGGLQVAGDYLQESSAFTLGIYAGNTICSGNVFSKKFQQQATTTTITSDVLTEYSFKADIFKKNTPYNILMTLGYRDLRKSFIAAGVQTNDVIGSIILGAKVTILPIKQLKLIADMEGVVYAFGLENLANRGPSMNTFLFKAGLGVSWTFDKGGDVPTTIVQEPSPLEAPILEESKMEGAGTESSSGDSDSGETSAPAQ